MRLNSPQINILTKACMKASKPLIRDFGEIENLQVSAKGPGDFVSSADKKVEEIIINELLKAHPDFGILSEEIGVINKDNKENRWIIDPIDGTMNFLNGVPQFAISIGYEEKKEIICGIIFDPIKNEMFVAEKGQGAFLNNSRIRVSKKKILKILCLLRVDQKIVCKGTIFFKEFIEMSNIVDAPIRKFGSASLDMANVACGRFDGFWQWDLNYWDIAAGKIIVKEAGGFVDFLENDEKSTNRRNLIATNSIIHEELHSAIFKKNIE